MNPNGSKVKPFEPLFSGNKPLEINDLQNLLEINNLDV